MLLARLWVLARELLVGLPGLGQGRKVFISSQASSKTHISFLPRASSLAGSACGFPGVEGKKLKLPLAPRAEPWCLAQLSCPSTSCAPGMEMERLPAAEEPWLPTLHLGIGWAEGWTDGQPLSCSESGTGPSLQPRRGMPSAGRQFGAGLGPCLGQTPKSL